jgi:phytoene dehydrogenase-like protein
MEKESMGAKLFDYITDKKIQWNKLPYEYEKFIYPDFTFTVPANEQEYIKKLCEKFPKEALPIKQYFQDLTNASKWIQSKMVAELVPAFVGYFVRLWNKRRENLALSTTKSYMDSHFKDEKLKALLVSHWGDYGLPPGKSAFVMHSIVTRHYLNGPVYPEGGAGKIAQAMEPIVTANGGKCILNAEATRLLVENGAVKGVEVQHKRGDKQKEIFEAPIVISSTGAYHTYTKLLDGLIPSSYAEELKKFPKGKSAITLFLGLKKDPRELGFNGCNNWICDSYDHDEVESNYSNLLQGKPKACYLSFPSLKNSKAIGHTAEIISFANFESFKEWENTKWKKRGEEYEKLKSIIAEGLLDLVEKKFPGFKDLVEFQEVSTPLTYMDLIGKPNGEFYGLAAYPERYKVKWLGPKTPIKNFYLSGTDAMSLGIMGALMGGVAAAACVLAPAGFPKIMKAINK